MENVLLIPRIHAQKDSMSIRNPFYAVNAQHHVKNANLKKVFALSAGTFMNQIGSIGLISLV